MKMTKIQLKRNEKSITVGDLAARVSDSSRAPSTSSSHGGYQFLIETALGLTREDARRKVGLERITSEFSEILGKPVDAMTVLTLEEVAAWHVQRDDIEIAQDRLMPDVRSQYEIALALFLQRGLVVQSDRVPEQATDGATTAAAHDVASATDWVCRARELAQTIGEEKWRVGEREITARGVCERVATELCKEKYYGTRGPRSASNVRSEALKGWRFSPPGNVA
jgi:hypothetical protein